MSMMTWAVVVAVAVGWGWFFLSRRRQAAEARALVKGGAQLVDVRSREEFDQGHLPGAKNLPVDVLAGRTRELGSKDKPVVVYCRSGARSGRAASLLRAAGFKKVVNLGPMSAF
jgi:rhodanese-related sulfurtransferase